ncbi:hypothetical protein NCAS_0I00430 [Naumovozyma castellii]|uniref:Mediator complex subunit 15 KIX domain-containing protein n=1 Tax=Naumovozyma castellii TaxID=27288 RepID=G0VJN1_NAUCA|nr:hypothetical protein NCAS_0I00430 [Naumovozyma castellii CBS 4309]CCC71711.1 hypothetical protein NCAS_0I00430 [Naumovozyma castellii CBS 4309]
MNYNSTLQAQTKGVGSSPSEPLTMGQKLRASNINKLIQILMKLNFANGGDSNTATTIKEQAKVFENAVFSKFSNDLNSYTKFMNGKMENLVRTSQAKKAKINGLMDSSLLMNRPTGPNNRTTPSGKTLLDKNNTTEQELVKKFQFIPVPMTILENIPKFLTFHANPQNEMFTWPRISKWVIDNKSLFSMNDLAIIKHLYQSQYQNFKQANFNPVSQLNATAYNNSTYINNIPDTTNNNSHNLLNQINEIFIQEQQAYLLNKKKNVVNPDPDQSKLRSMNINTINKPPSPEDWSIIKRISSEISKTQFNLSNLSNSLSGREKLDIKKSLSDNQPLFKKVKFFAIAYFIASKDESFLRDFLKLNLFLREIINKINDGVFIINSMIMNKINLKFQKFWEIMSQQYVKNNTPSQAVPSPIPVDKKLRRQEVKSRYKHHQDIFEGSSTPDLFLSTLSDCLGLSVTTQARMNTMTVYEPILPFTKKTIELINGSSTKKQPFTKTQLKRREKDVFELSIIASDTKLLMKNKNVNSRLESISDKQIANVFKFQNMEQRESETTPPPSNTTSPMIPQKRSILTDTTEQQRRKKPNVSVATPTVPTSTSSLTSTTKTLTSTQISPASSEVNEDESVQQQKSKIFKEVIKNDISNWNWNIWENI